MVCSCLVGVSRRRRCEVIALDLLVVVVRHAYARARAPNADRRWWDVPAQRRGGLSTTNYTSTFECDKNQPTRRLVLASSRVEPCREHEWQTQHRPITQRWWTSGALPIERLVNEEPLAVESLILGFQPEALVAVHGGLLELATPAARSL